jgi:hypothetical protein
VAVGPARAQTHGMGPLEGPGQPSGRSRPLGLSSAALLALAFAAVLLVAHLAGGSSLGRLPPTTTGLDDAEPIDGPAETTLYLGGQQPVSVALDSGLATRLPAPNRDQVVLTAVGDTILALAGRQAWVMPAGGQASRSARQAARRLGDADSLLPSRSPGRVWLVTIDYADEASYDMVEVGLADGRAVARHTLPAWAPPVAVTGAGLVTRNFVDGGLDLRGPDGRVRRLATDRQAGFVDAHGDLIAWSDRAGLHLYRVDQAVDRVVTPPAGAGGWVTYGPISRSACCLVTGAFSPDGRTLALFTTINGPDDPGLALVDTATAVAAGVPGSGDAMPGSCQACMAWSGDGRWLFYLGITPGSIWAVAMGGDGRPRLAKPTPARPLAVRLEGVTEAPFTSLAAR